jgi:rhomboid family GlyGly-CTERM serine protease
MSNRLSRLWGGSTLCLLTVSTLALLSMTLPAGWQHGLEYQHRAIGDGELWRLISGHLVHLGWEHLLMNLLGLGMIWGLWLRYESLWSCSLSLLMIAIGTSIGLYLINPGIAWYRGLSGVLHGLLVWALLRQWQSQPRLQTLMLGLVALKLAWEQVSGPLPGSAALLSGRIIVEAHLYGALAGALLWVLQWVRDV